MKIWGIVRSAANLILAKYTDGDLKQPNLTVAGNVAVETILTTPGGLVPATAETDDGAIAPGQTAAFTISLPYIFNPVAGGWIRPDTLPDNADAQAALGVGALGTVARLQGWNGATYDRVRTLPDNADAQAALGVGALGTVARLQGWNGATYDRVRFVNSGVMAAQPKNGVLATAPCGHWSVSIISAIGVIGTITKAGIAGSAHVATSLTLTLGMAPLGTTFNVVLRDGASGVGTILWQTFNAGIAAGGFNCIVIPSLAIVGSVGNAMTLEYTATAAGVAQGVAMTGFDVA